MIKLTLALCLDVGLCVFFATNALSLLKGASIGTALTRGLLALAIFGFLGVVAGLALSLASPSKEEPPADEPFAGDDASLSESVPGQP